MMPSKPNRAYQPTLKGFMCYKCKQRPAVFVSREYSCADCLERFLKIHLKELYPKSSVATSEPSLYYVLTGTLPSIALFHLLLTSATYPIQGIVHIPTLALFPIKAKKLQADPFWLQKHLPQLLETLPEAQNYTWYQVHPLTFSVQILHQPLDKNEKVFTSNVSENYNDEIFTIMDGILNHDKTGSIAFVNVLKERALCAFSEIVGPGCEFLFDTVAEEKAENIMNFICRGAGAHVPYAVTSRDTRYYPKFTIRHPAKSFFSKELVFYHHLHRLPTFPINPFFYCGPNDSSNSCNTSTDIISNFIQSSNHFPSSNLPTILKTGEKLPLPTLHNRCPLCFGPSDEYYQDKNWWSQDQLQILKTYILSVESTSFLCFACQRLCASNEFNGQMGAYLCQSGHNLYQYLKVSTNKSINIEA